MHCLVERGLSHSFFMMGWRIAKWQKLFLILSLNRMFAVNILAKN